MDDPGQRRELLERYRLVVEGLAARPQIEGTDQ